MKGFTLGLLILCSTAIRAGETPFLPSDPGERSRPPLRSQPHTAVPGKMAVTLADGPIIGVRPRSVQGLAAQGEIDLPFRGGATQAAPLFFDSDGVRLHYSDEGAGEPVILVHGFATDQTLNWATLIPALRGKNRIVAFDHRGHGRSARPTGQGKYGRHMVEDIRRLMDHLHLRQAHLVGYSMGGLIVGKFLAEHPDRVRSAVIGGISCAEPDEPWRQCMAALVASLEAGRGLGPLFAFLGQDRDPGRLPGPEPIVPAAADQASMAACVRQFPEFTVPDGQLAANVIPTLALIGDQDPFRAAVVRL